MTNNEKITRTPIASTNAELVTVPAFEEQTEHHDMIIRQAYVDGLINRELAGCLNRKYIWQATSLYSDYLNRLDQGAANLTFRSDYSLKANNGITAAIEHSTFAAEASGAQKLQYDNLDVQAETYLTLCSLFTNNSYIGLISREIRRQMEDQMTKDSSNTYFIGDSGFIEISPDQEFYINNSHQLVIVFDEYAVTPGVMGTPEFIIPTELITGILANELYIV